MKFLPGTFYPLSTLPNISICQPMSRGWLQGLCAVTIIYVARLVPPIYKALPGTQYTYTLKPLYIYLFNLPLYRIYLFTPKPLLFTYFAYPIFTSLPKSLYLYLFTPILNPYTYTFALPLYLFIYALYFVIGLPLLCTRYTYPYTYIYIYLYTCLFVYLARTGIFC